MFSTEVRQTKAECWQSPWRGVGETVSGRPRFYVQLSVEEMFTAAATGRISIPDAQMPEVAARQRRQRAALERIGVGEELIRKVVLA